MNRDVLQESGGAAVWWGEDGAPSVWVESVLQQPGGFSRRSHAVMNVLCSLTSHAERSLLGAPPKTTDASHSVSCSSVFPGRTLTPPSSLIDSSEDEGNVEARN